MNRRMDQHDVGPSAAKASAGGFAAMRGAVVGNPEHPARGTVGLLAHDLRDEAFERSDPGLVLAASEQLGTMNIPGREVCPSALARILMLDVSGASWSRWQGRMLAASGLDAGLLVSAQHVVARPQNSAFPTTLIERSRIGPALAAKSGSRGNIQQRWRHGRRASWLSQRQRVVPLIWATRPWAIASRRNSASDQRASGNPRRDGNSQASALISTITLGGKAGGSPAPRLLFKSR